MNLPKLDKSLFESKRFISAVAVVIAMVLVVLVPDFQNVETELVEALTVLGLALVTGYTITDLTSIFVVLRVIAKLTSTTADDQLLELLAPKPK